MAALIRSPADFRRLILKIGSALLVEEDSGRVRHDWLAALAADIARCRARGQDVILVSSGAIAVGRRHLGLAGRTLRLEEKQAAAATGQIRLAHAWQEALARHDMAGSRRIDNTAEAFLEYTLQLQAGSDTVVSE